MEERYRKILIPFKENEPRSWFLYRKCVQDFFRKMKIKKYQLMLKKVLAAMVNAEDRSAVWKDAGELEDKLFEQIYPLSSREAEKLNKSAISEMLQTWESVFGKRGDPETERAIKETARRLFKMKKRS